MTKIKIIKIFLFILLVIACDFTAGYCLDYAYFHSISGKFYKLNYVITKSKAEILIFGNSHAECHYIPSIIKDSLHEDCYNAGFRNQDILFTYAIHKSILKRYSPGLIILNIDKGMLYANNAAFDNQEGKLSELLPFCKKEPDIREEIESRSSFEKFKLLSGIYPFNSSVIYLLKYFLSRSDNFIDGYYPVFGRYKPTHKSEKEQLAEKDGGCINKKLVGKLTDMFNRFRVHNTQIIAVISPTFHSSWKVDDSVTSIFSRQGIPLLDYSKDQHFSNSEAYFTDGHHLNNEGAKLFSAIVAHDIKSILKKIN